MRATVAWLLAQPKRPGAVVINGDLAMFDGQPGDYEYFARLIQPLRDAALAVYLMMGNHDDRAAFYNVLQTEKPLQPIVEARHIGVVKLPRTNLFLLDSLKQEIVASGDLGERQLRWLESELDAHPDKPALIIVHHNPRLGGDPIHFPGGLEDTDDLWRIIATRKQVKAYIHGHVHDRKYSEHDGIHILNMPAVGYVADKRLSTTGWTMLRLLDDGAELTTHTHLADHDWNGVKVNLTWRN